MTRRAACGKAVNRISPIWHIGIQLDCNMPDSTSESRWTPWSTSIAVRGCRDTCNTRYKTVYEYHVHCGGGNGQSDLRLLCHLPPLADSAISLRRNWDITPRFCILRSVLLCMRDGEASVAEREPRGRSSPREPLPHSNVSSEGHCRGRQPENRTRDPWINSPMPYSLDQRVLSVLTSIYCGFAP